MSEDYFYLGVRAAQAGNFPLAQEYLSQAVRQAPDSAQTWYWLGLVLEDPEKKKYCLSRAAQLGHSPPEEPALEPPVLPPVLPPDLPPDQPSANPPSDPPGTVAAGGTPPRPARAEPAAAVAVADAGVPAPPAETSEPATPLWMAIAGVALLLLVCGTALWLYLDYQSRIQHPPAAIQAQAVLPTRTRLVLPTLIPSETPSPSATRTPSPTPSQTPTFDPTQLYRHLGFQITAARIALDNERSSECISSYDKLLSDLPEWPIGYYNRGVCKRQASAWTHSLFEFDEYLRGAIEDQDMALSLDPYYSNAYVERAFDYNRLINTVGTSADEQVVLTMALENLQAALDLGTTHPSAQLNLALIQISLGRCQEGLQEALRQINVLPPGAYPEPQLYHAVSLGYYCLGDYAQALTANQKSLAIRDELAARQFQAGILIGQGETDQALEVLDQSIQIKPDFHGYRFYLRALIHHDRGDIDLARQDLISGYRYTWHHRGLYAFLVGMLALYDGDLEQGIEWLQYASDSIQPEEGLWLMQRIRAELARLGAPGIASTPSVKWDVTPIPPQRITPTRTPTAR